MPDHPRSLDKKAPSKIWNLETPNAEPRIKKGEVKKLSRSLEKVWIVGIRIWNTHPYSATHENDLRFPFKKLIYDRARASENLHKNFAF
jgi:hypothetical protein